MRKFLLTSLNFSCFSLCLLSHRGEEPRSVFFGLLTDAERLLFSPPRAPNILFSRSNEPCNASIFSQGTRSIRHADHLGCPPPSSLQFINAFVILEGDNTGRQSPTWTVAVGLSHLPRCRTLLSSVLNFIRSLLAPSSSLSSFLDRSPALKCTDRSPCRCEESALHHLLEIIDTDVKQDHSLQTPTVPHLLLASFKMNVSFCTSRSLSHPKVRF